MKLNRRPAVDYYQSHVVRDLRNVLLNQGGFQMFHQRGIHFSLFGRRLPCDGDPVHDPQPHPRRRQLRLRRGLVAQGQVVCVGTEQLVTDSIPTGEVQINFQ